MLLLVALFVILGNFIDAIPAIIIFMPIINKLTQVGHINPVHMRVVIITEHSRHKRGVAAGQRVGGASPAHAARSNLT